MRLDWLRSVQWLGGGLATWCCGMVAVSLVILVLPLARGEDIIVVRVLYERALTEEEKNRYEIGGSMRSLDPGETVESLAEMCKLPMHWRAIKCEIVTRDGHKLLFRTFSLGRDLLMLREEHEWVESARSRLILGEDCPGLKFLDSSVRYTDTNALYVDGEDCLGMATAEFQTQSGDPISVCVYEALGEATISPHEFLRGVFHPGVGKDLPVVETAFGPVVRFTRDGSFKHLAWRSGSKWAIYIGSRNQDPTQFAEYYGAKFPSSLPPSFPANATTWARNEVESVIAKLEQILAHPIAGENVTRTADRCRRQVNRLSPIAYIPIAEAEGAGCSVDKEKQRVFLEELKQWWAAHKVDTYWNVWDGYLVAKGETKQDIIARAEAAKERERQDRERAILERPFSVEDQNRAVQTLIARLDKENIEFVESVRKSKIDAATGDEDRVTWKRVDEHTWRLEWPQQKGGPLVSQTFTGPTVVSTQDRKRPLKATYMVTFGTEGYEHRKDDSVEEVFFYDRLLDEWSRR